LLLVGFGCFDEDDDLVMSTASRYGLGAAFSFLGLEHIMAWFRLFYSPLFSVALV